MTVFVTELVLVQAVFSCVAAGVSPVLVFLVPQEPPPVALAVRKVLRLAVLMLAVLPLGQMKYRVWPQGALAARAQLDPPVLALAGVLTLLHYQKSR